MPEDKYPDFSFLHEGGSSSDSAILEAEQSQQESASAAEPPVTEQTASAEPTEPEQKLPEAAPAEPESNSNPAEAAAEPATPPSTEAEAATEEPPATAEGPAESAKRDAEEGPTKKKRYDSYAAQPAWMDQSPDDSPQDSSTRFASVFGGSSSPSAESPPPAAEAAQADLATPPAQQTADSSAAQATVGNPPPEQETPSTESASSEESVATSPTAETPPSPAVESTGVTAPVAPETQANTPAEVAASGNEETQLDTPPLDSPPAEPPSEKTEAAPPAVSPATATSPPVSTTPTTRSRSSSRKQKQGQGPPKNLTFMLLASYASAVTLVCLYLLMQSLAGQPHHLESLPDLKPPMEKGEIGYRLVPEEAGLPRGHTLRLGESRRFGNVQVTPLRVEKRPLRFTHFSGNPQQTRAETEPVLKLWVRFENVSRDQKFAPLDRELLLKRVVDPSRPEFVRSNQFLVPTSSKGNLSKTRLLYDLEMYSDWNFAGFEDDPVLAPGESVELYFPSAEVRAEQIPLDQPLLWRVQFRKGYHPESYRGVTTLIEIKIDSNAIQA